MKKAFFYLVPIVLFLSCRKSITETPAVESASGPSQSSEATVAERVYNMKQGIDPYLPRWSDTMYAARVKNGKAKVFMGNSQIERMIWYNWDAIWRDSLAINRGIGGTTWSEKIPYYSQLIYEYKPGDVIFYDGDNEYLRWTQSTRNVSATITPVFNRAMDSVTKHTPTSRIFIVSMVTSPKLAVRGFAADIDALNKSYQSRIASDNVNFPGRMHFVDIRSIYPTNSSKWETDSIHIKGANYYEWHNKLKSVLAATPPYKQTTNIAPVARAGADKVTYRSSVTLDGSGSSDADGWIKSYKWQFVSGPSRYAIISPASSKTRVEKLATGVYTFRLTVTDNNNVTDTDDVNVTVR